MTPRAFKKIIGIATPSQDTERSSEDFLMYVKSRFPDFVISMECPYTLSPANTIPLKELLLEVTQRDGKTYLRIFRSSGVEGLFETQNANRLQNHLKFFSATAKDVVTLKEGEEISTDKLNLLKPIENVLQFSVELKEGGFVLTRYQAFSKNQHYLEDERIPIIRHFAAQKTAEKVLTVFLALVLGLPSLYLFYTFWPLLTGEAKQHFRGRNPEYMPMSERIMISTVLLGVLFPLLIQLNNYQKVATEEKKTLSALREQMQSLGSVSKEELLKPPSQDPAQAT